MVLGVVRSACWWLVVDVLAGVQVVGDPELVVGGHVGEPLARAAPLLQPHRRDGVVAPEVHA